ncbi:MAG: hypothetical protein OXR68_05100 [Alphaproteobacteria bacterium]|nr:hypothetical protein [Alphaproteobacteria bacterium]MDD9919980.1 hypothetical protein [Alphaproteobacteria bacterium]
MTQKLTYTLAEVTDQQLAYAARIKKDTNFKDYVAAKRSDGRLVLIPESVVPQGVQNQALGEETPFELRTAAEKHVFVFPAGEKIAKM